MQSTVRIAVALVLLTSVFAGAYHSSAKLRRDGVLNLYPFPRVGRASRLTWQVPIPPYDFYSDYDLLDKRHMYAFPRVGRGDLSLLRRDPVFGEQVQMSQRSDNTGMWFGPRIGRSFKSDEDDVRYQNENSDHSEPERMESVNEEREKRQTHLN